VTGAAKTLEEAEAAYTSRDLAKAKKLFLQILEQTDSKPLHASAYYGLGRTALLEKDLDAAERLFQNRSIPNPPLSTWVGITSTSADFRWRRAIMTPPPNFSNHPAVGRRDREARQAAQQGLQQIKK